MAGINWFHVLFVVPTLSTVVGYNIQDVVLPKWFIYCLIIIIIGMGSFHLIKGVSDLINPAPASKD